MEQHSVLGRESMPFGEVLGQVQRRVRQLPILCVGRVVYQVGELEHCLIIRECVDVILMVQGNNQCAFLWALERRGRCNRWSISSVYRPNL